MKKVYVASLFSEIEESKKRALRLQEALGWEPVSSWVFGGEEGLSRTQIAVKDIREVEQCDVLVVFSHPRGEPKPGGGRWVEFGYAMAKGKQVFVVGPYENVFTHSPNVVVYPTLECLISDMELV